MQHFLAVARTLALVSGIAAPALACGGRVEPPLPFPAPPDATTDDDGYDGVAMGFAQNDAGQPDACDGSTYNGSGTGIGPPPGC